MHRYNYKSFTFCISSIYVSFQLTVYSYVCVCVGTQSCPTPCDPTDCSLPAFIVHGISQAAILKWVAISFSWGSSPFRNQTRVSCIFCIGRQILYHLGISLQLVALTCSSYSLQFSFLLPRITKRPHQKKFLTPGQMWCIATGFRKYCLLLLWMFFSEQMTSSSQDQCMGILIFISNCSDKQEMSYYIGKTSQ